VLPEVSPVALAQGTGHASALAWPDLESIPEYQSAATQVDVRASCRLASLYHKCRRLEQLSILREQALHFLQDAIP